MTDDELFSEALSAYDDARPVSAPEGFAERVLGEVTPRRDPTRARPWRAAAVAAAAALALAGWQTRARAGELTLAWGDGPAREVSLGRRARAVVEPGSALRWNVGGWNPARPDVAELATGSVFLRVDSGEGFDLRTPQGTVHVTGTCFRVSAVTSQGDDDMTRMMRARWFGAGALSVALAVTVYEGRVTLARPRGGPALTLSAGESAVVRRDGTLARGAAATHDARDATPTSSVTAVPEGDRAASTAARAEAESLRREVERLRGVLSANRISPETGAPTGERRRGLDNDGDTDLSPDEWRALALRGELRFALPGVGGRDPQGRVAQEARALGLREHEVEGVQEVFRRSEARLTGELRGLYREAAGGEPGSLALDALQTEIRDKTPLETVAQVDRRLAYERGGLLPATAPSPEMSPYERMMRALVGYEPGLDRELGALVGERDARELLHGEHAVGRHSYGRGWGARDGGSR